MRHQDGAQDGTWGTETGREGTGREHRTGHEASGWEMALRGHKVMGWAMGGSRVGHRVGQEPQEWDIKNQERTWSTRMGHEELGWDRRSQEGTGDDRMGHKMGHGALGWDRSHWDMSLGCDMRSWT